MKGIKYVGLILVLAAVAYFNMFKPRPYALGEQINDFTLETLDGTQFNLSDYKDRIIFIEFFSTDCTYCQQAYASTGSLEQRVLSGQSDVVFLSVNRGESQKKVQDFVESYRKKWPVLLDQRKKVYERFFDQGVPAFVIIDNGKLVYQETGWSSTLVDGLAYELEDLELSG